MQEHPVPQNVTSFEFKLIGDMTLRQFGYVATGLIIALIAFFLPSNRLPILAVYFIKYPTIVIAPVIAFALAFVPIEGRPLDKWLLSFMRAVFGNTLYVWKKEGNDLSMLNDLHVQLQPQQPLPQGGVPARRPMSRLDALENQSLARLGMRPQQPRAGQVLQRRAVARPGQIAAFAGSPTGQPTIPAPQARQAVPQTPAVMREPHQRPLAPQKIPLPAYQQASLTQHLAGEQNPTSAILPLSRPQVVTDRQAPVSRPRMASTSLTPTGSNMAPSSQTSTVLQLIQQNRMLMQKMAQLESRLTPNTITKELTPLEDENKRLSAQNQKLTSQLSWLESTISGMQKNLTSLAGEETKYQESLNALTEKLNAAGEEKRQAEQQIDQLQKAQQSHSDLLETSQTEKQAMAQKFADMQAELANTKKIYDELQEQKQQLEAQIHNQVVLAHEERQQEHAANQQPMSQATDQSTKPATATAPAVPQPTHEEPSKQSAPVVPAAPAPEQPQVANLPALTTIPNAICGYVFDSGAKPIADVVVVVKKAQGPTMRALKTNRVGQFNMVSPLPDGPYEVTFEKDGYTFTNVAITANGALIPPLQVQGKSVS